MTIEIKFRDNLYFADMLDLSGSPYNGIATTEGEAICNLFFQLLHPSNQKNGLDILIFLN